MQLVTPGDNVTSICSSVHGFLSANSSWGAPPYAVLHDPSVSRSLIFFPSSPGALVCGFRQGPSADGKPWAQRCPLLGVAKEKHKTFLYCYYEIIDCMTASSVEPFCLPTLFLKTASKIAVQLTSSSSPGVTWYHFISHL